MKNVEVIARMKIRDDQFEGFTNQVTEILRAARESAARTIRCDCFLDAGRTVAEFHETFADEQALIEHKMTTMAATSVLFQRYANDHEATIYGSVSRAFLDLVAQRAGPPRVFGFLCGARRPGDGEGTALLEFGAANDPLEVIARLKIRPGELAGFVARAAELVRLTEELDTRTLRYDWFISADETECEVHEAYVSPDGLVEHNHHVLEARSRLLRDHADGHRMSAFGTISPELRELGHRHAGGIEEFSFVQGLGSTSLIDAPQ